MRLGVPVKRITRIPHAALAGYADVEPVPPAVPDGVPVALFAGLIRPYKGLADLLDAWPAVRQRVPGAILHVLGRSLGGDDDAARAAASEGVRRRPPLRRARRVGGRHAARRRRGAAVPLDRPVGRAGDGDRARPAGDRDRRGRVRRDARRHRRRPARAAARSRRCWPRRSPPCCWTTGCARTWRRTRRPPPRASCRGIARPSATRSRTARRELEPRGARGVRRGLSRARRPGAGDAGADRDVRRVRLLRDGAAAGRRRAGHAPALLPRVRVRADSGVPRHAVVRRGLPRVAARDQRPARGAHDAAHLAPRAGAGTAGVAQRPPAFDLRGRRVPVVAAVHRPDLVGEPARPDRRRAGAAGGPARTRRAALGRAGVRRAGWCRVPRRIRGGSS